MTTQGSRGELLLEEHAEARWVAVDGLNEYDWAPADVPIVEGVVEST